MNNLAADTSADAGFLSGKDYYMAAQLAPSEVSLGSEADEDGRIGHRILLFVTVSLMFVLKYLFIRNLQVNSDETQHLHVVWAWAQGMVQYRDVFDNHTPLFQMLFAPLFAFLGERPDIILPMRWAMLPLFLGSLGCVYWIASRLFSPKTGLWATVVAGATPVFLTISTQFRTDNLWALSCLSVLAVALTSRLTLLRALITGLLIGTAFMVSMKTSLLLFSLLAAIGIVLMFQRKTDGGIVSKKGLTALILGILGLMIVPIGVSAYIYSRGALPQMWYCVIEHNVVPGLGNWHGHLGRHFFLYPALLPLIGFLGYNIFQGEPDGWLASRRAILFFTAAIYAHTLYCWWPLVTRQDFLPVTPLFAILATPLLLIFGRRLFMGTAYGSMPLGEAIFPALTAMLFLLLSVVWFKPLRDSATSASALIADALRLTTPADYLMDAKGETVFRRRPFYYALEGVTKQRLKLSLINDSIQDDMVKTRTCVASLNRLPPGPFAWVSKYYLPVTPVLRVAGSLVENPIPGQQHSFEVVIPATYRLISPHGIASGSIDGIPCRGAVFLNPGIHTLVCPVHGVVAILWNHAIETGFSPFSQDSKKDDRSSKNDFISSQP